MFKKMVIKIAAFARKPNEITWMWVEFKTSFIIGADWFLFPDWAIGEQEIWCYFLSLDIPLLKARRERQLKDSKNL